MAKSTKIGQVARLFQIITILMSRRDGERVTRLQLGELMGYSDKTVQRDVNHLKDAEVPIEYDSEEGSYVLTNKAWTFPVVALTPSDVLALGLVEAWISNESSAFPYSAQISSALGKTTRCLTPALMARFRSVGEHLAEVGGTARRYSDAPVGLLLQASMENKTIETLYESRNSGKKEIKLRRIDPYRLDRRDGQYYDLQGFCHERQAMRTFAPDRMRNLRITDEVFKRRDWSPEDAGVVSGLRSSSRVVVEVRFGERVADYARDRRWNAGETFEEGPDGSVVMRGEAQGADGLVKELLRWGRYVEVIGGPELRQAIIEEIGEMKKVYEGDSPVARPPTLP